VLCARPRRTFCVIEHLHRNRAVADAVVEGCFPIQGRTLELGVEPSWLGAKLPADREWRLEWSKFYYGLDLADAGAATGDLKYLRVWQRLVDGWIGQVPVDFDPTDVAARRVSNWVYAWSRFAETFGALCDADGFSDRLSLSVCRQLSYVKNHLTRERNHRTLELYALFIGALALPWLDPDHGLLDFSIAALHHNLLDDVLADGVQRERSTHYHHVVLRSFVGLCENARRFGLSLPDGFDARLARACDFSMHCHRPDGCIPALSDSDTGSYLDLLRLAGSLLNRADWTYVGTRGVAGQPPRQRHAAFPLGGYFVQRSGWGDRTRSLAEERYLIFDCGELGDGGHGHYDALNVEIAAGGRPLVVDPGRYTYCDDPPHWRRWFKGTHAHNTVTVDGLDQTPYRRGKPKGAVARARLLHRFAGCGLDILWGEAVSPAYDVVHQRRVLFVAEEYWLIEDFLHSNTTHHYELRLHLTPEANETVSLGQTAGSCAVHTRGAVFVFGGDPSISLEAGWMAERYGIKEPAPVVVATMARCADARFLTLVMPTDVAASPVLHVADSGDTRTVEIDGGGTQPWRDRVMWTRTGEALPLIGFNEPAAAAWTRSSLAGDLMVQSIATVVDVWNDAGIERPACDECHEEVAW
jgi:hypothetical protein